MNKLNTQDLDGHILLTFITILESNSVSVAAEKLDVSHINSQSFPCKVAHHFGRPAVRQIRARLNTYRNCAVLEKSGPDCSRRA